MEPDYWIELEHNYFRRMKERMELWKEHGERIMFEVPGSELATRELMEMVLQYITIRYPHYFQLEDDNKVFRNRLLDIATVIDSMKPLELLYHHVPEDFAIMLRNEEDGNYYLRAAMIVSIFQKYFLPLLGTTLRTMIPELGFASSETCGSTFGQVAKLSG